MKNFQNAPVTLVACVLLVGCVHEEANGPSIAKPAAPVVRCVDVTSCEDACNGGHIDSCTKAADRMIERPLESDAKRLAQVLERSCDGGTGASCARLAELIVYSPVMTPDGSRADGLRKKACELGESAACLSAIVADGKLVDERAIAAQRQRVDKVRVLAASKCDAGDPKSCVVLATTYLGIPGVPSEHAKVDALMERVGDLLEKSCLAGKADDCARAAIHIIGPEGRNEPSRAVRLLERGCNASSAESCWLLAGVVARVPGGAGNQLGSLLIKSCDGGYAQACLAIGELALRSAGASTEARAAIDRGIKLARARCDLAETDGCDLLAGSLTLDALPIEDAKKTADHVEVVCDRGAGVTCHQLAQALILGPEALRDADRIAQLEKKACDNGYPFACADPMRALGIQPRLDASIVDRRSGLEWAPTPPRDGDIGEARAYCEELETGAHKDWRLPTKGDLSTLVDPSGGLRPFARGTVPREGHLFSGDAPGGSGSPWSLNVQTGRIDEAATHRAFARCVRTERVTKKGQQPTLSLRMTGENLEYAVRDPRGKVVTSGTLIRPSDAGQWAPLFDEKKVLDPVDVDVAPGVEWDLAARFLDVAKREGLTLARVTIEAKPGAAPK